MFQEGGVQVNVGAEFGRMWWTVAEGISEGKGVGFRWDFQAFSSEMCVVFDVERKGRIAGGRGEVGGRILGGSGGVSASESLS